MRWLGRMHQSLLPVFLHSSPSRAAPGLPSHLRSLLPLPIHLPSSLSLFNSADSTQPPQPYASLKGRTKKDEGKDGRDSRGQDAPLFSRTQLGGNLRRCRSESDTRAGRGQGLRAGRDKRLPETNGGNASVSPEARGVSVVVSVVVSVDVSFPGLFLWVWRGGRRGGRGVT